jgi:ATP-dependent DNA ligase
MPYEVALARAVEQIPAPGALPGGCRYDLKWDGYRALSRVDADGAQLWSRRGTDLSATFPEIIAALSDQLPAGTVLDGELVAWRDGRLAFEVLQQRMSRGPRAAAAAARTAPASLVLFDVLEVGGTDVRSLPFDERRAHLVELAGSWSPPLNLSPVTGDVEEARAWFEAYAPAGIEGLVVKGGAQPYRADRIWLKVKRRSTVDVVCGAVTGTLAAPREIVAGVLVDGVLRVAGHTTPLSSLARRQVAPLLRAPVRAHPWPANLAPGALGRWGTGRDPVPVTLVEPFVVEVSADAAWSGTSYRHPLRFVRSRPDTPVAEVTAALR